MTVSDAIQAVRVMLGQDVPTKKVELEDKTDEKKEEVAMASAVLVDGTEVYTEGDLVAGATLYVKTEDGETVTAPIGKHETTEGLIVTVAESGLIEKVEEVVAEEAPVSEELEETPKVEEEMDAESLLAAIADLIKGYSEEVVEVKEELSQLTERFEAVADLPAAKPVKKSFMAEAKAASVAADSRFDHLSTLRRKTLTK